MSSLIPTTSEELIDGEGWWVTGNSGNTFPPTRAVSYHHNGTNNFDEETSHLPPFARRFCHFALRPLPGGWGDEDDRNRNSEQRKDKGEGEEGKKGCEWSEEGEAKDETEFILESDVRRRLNDNGKNCAKSLAVYKEEEIFLRELEGDKELVNKVQDEEEEIINNGLDERWYRDIPPGMCAKWD